MRAPERTRGGQSTTSPGPAFSLCCVLVSDRVSPVASAAVLQTELPVKCAFSLTTVNRSARAASTLAYRRSHRSSDHTGPAGFVF